MVIPLCLASGWGVVRTVRSVTGDLVRVLQVDGSYQSATFLDERRMEPVFSYFRAFDAVFSVRPQTYRLVMIGGGGYAWPKHVLATQPPEVTLDVVEIDPALPRVARRWFFLDEACEHYPHRLRLIEGDGRAFLDEHAQTSAESPENDQSRYDALILDAFVGYEPARMLATVEALQAARACLVGDGLVAMNVVTRDNRSDVSFLRAVVATCHEVFAHTYVVPCEGEPLAAEDNYLVMATDGAWSVPTAIGYNDEFLGEVLTDATCLMM